MTYLDGMDWAAAQQADQDLKNTWAEVMGRFMNGNYRHANLVHADPHPGNYRFGADGSVGFLDFGCVQIVPEKQRGLWVRFLRAAMEGRSEEYRDLLSQMGFLTADSSLTDEELQQWVSDMAYETTSPQPVTYSPDATARIIRGFFDVRDGDHPVSKISVPATHAFTSRIMLASASVAAGLQATVPSRAIMDDMDGVAEPTTELGKTAPRLGPRTRSAGALEHHDHP